MINKSILVISGPNLNLLGNREEKYYGNISLDDIYEKIKKIALSNDITIECKQSNSESEIIKWIQNAKNSFKAIIINAGGFTHTSVALRDAIASVKSPAVEVHISNILSREDFRKKSYLSDVCSGIVSGLGLMGYEAAIKYFLEKK